MQGRGDMDAVRVVDWTRFTGSTGRTKAPLDLTPAH